MSQSLQASLDAYTELGVIHRAKGLQGEMVVLLHHALTGVESLPALFVQMEHTLVPYQLAKWVLKHQQALLKLQGVHDRQAAYHLKGRSIFALRAHLPTLPTFQVLLTELVDYSVVDTAIGPLGCVQDVYTTPFQQLLAVDYQGKELLIPYHEAIVKQIAHSAQCITVKLPPGFLKAQ